MGPLGDLGKSPLFCTTHWRRVNYSAMRWSWQSRGFTAIGFFTFVLLGTLQRNLA